MKKIKHSSFEGFNTSKRNKLQYQGRDARELLLYLTGREPTSENQIIVRKGYCQSPYCLNPAHYYWGTRKDVAYESASINENSIDTFLITKLRKESKNGISSRKLSKTYRLPYHSVRRICSYETYEDAENRKNDYNEKEIWDNLSKVCEKILIAFPEESKKYKLNIYQQTDFSNIENLKNFYNENKIYYRLFSFEENIINLISKANLCITRAGASTLSELTYLNVPYLAIPYPLAKDNHQYQNALFYKSKDCCWILQQDQLKNKVLANFLINIVNDKNDYLNKKKNMEKFSYKNTWNNINEKLVNTINEN
jgi:UDP-N-acetylglucosamine transferase subunit ALG13